MTEPTDGRDGPGVKLNRYWRMAGHGNLAINDPSGVTPAPSQQASSQRFSLGFAEWLAQMQFMVLGTR